MTEKMMNGVFVDLDEQGRIPVTLFKPGGKYYTSEMWTVPIDAIGPHDMDRSPDFRRIAGGHVLIDSTGFGYPFLFPGGGDTTPNENNPHGVKPGQVWADNDNREMGRHIKVLAIIGDRAQVHRCTSGGQLWTHGRDTKIGLHRFAYGYRLVKDVQ